MMDKPYMLQFPQHGDERGWLVVIEGVNDVPFDIKRIFYIYGSDESVIRGRHANRKSEFVLINVCGSCKVKTNDGRGNEDIFVLDKPHAGIYIPKLVWKDMYDFSEDSILLCMASEYYDPEEYIRDMDEFLSEMSEV
ncbi:sugar 3,4-ketoisomerase [Bariatricus sp. SGI.154]|uniref:sugar 3,4-ketoisomerase n=1 Tax=Bariatricus sp. SGI.154 TaxID=3420549 RepID=UPI003D002218